MEQFIPKDKTYLAWEEFKKNYKPEVVEALVKAVEKLENEKN